jgi:hypothetical protein
MRIGRALLLLVLCLAFAQIAHAEISPVVSCNRTFDTDHWDYEFTVDNHGGTADEFLFNNFRVDAGDPWYNTVHMNTTNAPDPYANVYGNGGYYVVWSIPDNARGSASVFTLSSDVMMDHVWWGTGSSIFAAQEYGGEVTFDAPQSGTPEPSSLLLLGLVMGPTLACRRRRGKFAKQ